jgi:hypothetical protein
MMGPQRTFRGARGVNSFGGRQGLTRRGLHRWLPPEEEGSHDHEDDPRPNPR